MNKGKIKREEATIARMHHPLLLNNAEAAIAVNSADAHESTRLVDIDASRNVFLVCFHSVLEVAHSH